MNGKPDLVGVGLYTIGDASRLAEVTSARVRGWVEGYAQSRARPRSPALINRSLPNLEGRIALSFRELIEVRFVRHFLRAGVSWRALRQAAQRARQELLGDNGARLRFSTDGVTVFVDALADGGDRRARDLVANQYVLLSILEQSMQSEFDLDGDRLIRAWIPRHETPLVLINPARSFGRPVVEPGVPTSTLTDALTAERGNAGRVAALFDTTEEAVRQAAAFELNLAA